MGDLNDGTYPVGLNVPVHIGDPMDVLVVNHLTVNAGHKDWATVDGVLTQAGTQLASAGVKAAASAIASGVGALSERPSGASSCRSSVPSLGRRQGG